MGLYNWYKQINKDTYPFIIEKYYKTQATKDVFKDTLNNIFSEGGFIGSYEDKSDGLYYKFKSITKLSQLSVSYEGGFHKISEGNIFSLHILMPKSINFLYTLSIFIFTSILYLTLFDIIPFETGIIFEVVLIVINLVPFIMRSILYLLYEKRLIIFLEYRMYGIDRIKSKQYNKMMSDNLYTQFRDDVNSKLRR